MFAETICVNTIYVRVQAVLERRNKIQTKYIRLLENKQSQLRAKVNFYKLVLL